MRKVVDLTDKEDEQFCEIISEAFGIEVFSYNSRVTEEFYAVLEESVGEHNYNSEIAKKTGLSESHVELIKYLLCNNDNAEYGTSPRGCWLTEKGLEVYGQLKALLEKPSDNPLDIVV